MDGLQHEFEAGQLDPTREPVTGNGGHGTSHPLDGLQHEFEAGQLDPTREPTTSRPGQTGRAATPAEWRARVEQAVADIQARSDQRINAVEGARPDGQATGLEHIESLVARIVSVEDPAARAPLIEELVGRLNDLGLLGSDAELRWDVIRASGELDHMSRPVRELIDSIASGHDHMEAREVGSGRLELDRSPERLDADVLAEGENAPPGEQHHQPLDQPLDQPVDQPVDQAGPPAGEAMSVEPPSPDVAVPPRPESVSAAGTEWTAESGGWYSAREGGSLQFVDGDARVVTVELPEGSRGLVDASGQLRVVVQPDGISFDRGLNGEWSRPRVAEGEVSLSRLTQPMSLEMADGPTLLLTSGDVVRDMVTGQPLAYLSGEHTYVPTAEGRWTEVQSQSTDVQGWLASANKAFETSRLLFDITARSDLARLSDVELGDLLVSRDRDAAAAAVYELINRVEGKQMRWTQLYAVEGLLNGEMIHMDPGEGKSLVMYAAAGRELATGEVDAVMAFTSSDILVAKDIEVLQRLFPKERGFDVVQIKPDGTAPLPVKGRKTLYVGTIKDAGFAYLRDWPVFNDVKLSIYANEWKHELFPYEPEPEKYELSAFVDEIDGVALHSNTTFIISDGQTSRASAFVEGQVTWARDWLGAKVADGSLTPAHFGRTEDQIGGRAALTEIGRAKVAQLLGHPPTEWELMRLDRAASARWEYIENKHYIVHKGKLYIIDQTDHSVLVDLSTDTSKTSESRWSNGVAQAIEAKHMEDRHGLEIRSDSATSKSVTAREILSEKNFRKIAGASGTNRGHGAEYEALGMSGKVREIPRYYASELKQYQEQVFGSHAEKIDKIVADIRDMHTVKVEVDEVMQDKPGRPQLTIVDQNQIARELSDKLTAAGVPHKVVDARWYLEQGSTWETAFADIVGQAGQMGEVVIGIGKLGRGVDIPVSAEAEAAGGLHVRLTAHSAKSVDFDQQAVNRTARSGHNGSYEIYSAITDEIFTESNSPDAQVVNTQYTNAVKAHRLNPITGLTDVNVEHHAWQLRRLVPQLHSAIAAQATAQAQLQQLLANLPNTHSTPTAPHTTPTPQQQAAPAAAGPQQATPTPQQQATTAWQQQATPQPQPQATPQPVWHGTPAPQQQGVAAPADEQALTTLLHLIQGTDPTTGVTAAQAGSAWTQATALEHSVQTGVLTAPEHNGAPLTAAQAMAHQVPADQLPTLVNQAVPRTGPVPGWYRPWPNSTRAYGGPPSSTDRPSRSPSPTSPPHPASRSATPCPRVAWHSCSPAASPHR